MTISARSTSSRSTSSRRIKVSSKSKGPAKTSRSSSRSARRTEQKLAAASDRPHPHRLAHIGERGRGDRARLLRTAGECVFERGLVRAQLLVALADRAEVVDYRVGHRLLERAVARPVERR